MSKVLLAVVFAILSLVVLYAHQSPVNYIDSVDAVQANIANQKYAEWITANDADIDTLETLSESVFQAVDTTGGQSVANNDSAFVKLDKEVIEGSIYVHAADDYAVGIKVDGVYEISFHIVIGSPAMGTAAAACLVHYTSSWGQVQGMYFNAHASSLYPELVGGSRIMPLSSGDSIAIELINPSTGSDSVDPEANGTGLTVKKLY